MDSVENPTLKETIEPENDLKNMLVEYVGEKLDPDDSNVNIEMIVEVMAKEFPEFLLALAEENWILGYQQAIADVDTARQIKQNTEND
tara:strand:- start:41 stop:304 length:264 start_codon:yes stop_codon:yes gene_type:complete